MLVKEDTATEAAWIGAYGSQGYNIIGDAVSYPSYANVTVAGVTSFTASTPPIPAAALQVPSGTGSFAGGWHSSTSFTIDVNLTDGHAHDIALYAVDWSGNNSPVEKFQITSAATGALLSTVTLQSFARGTYIQWRLTESVVITVTNLAGPNALLSGIFFDPPSVPAPRRPEPRRPTS